MAKKRDTPEEDFERFSERIWRDSYGSIKDRESFNAFFDEYVEHITTSRDLVLREKAWKILSEEHPDIKKKIPKMKVVKKKIPPRIPDEEFKKIGYVHKRIVYSRATKVKIHKKVGFRTVTRYRDRKGRFVRIEKP